MSEVLQVSAAIAASLLAAAGLLAGSGLARRWAVLVALGLAAVLLVAQSWNGELRELRDQPLALALGTAGGIVVLAGLTALFVRRPNVLPLLALGALPFRVPIDTGADTVNLLLPLYLVIGAGALAAALGTSREGRLPVPPALAATFAAAIVLYAIQSSYSRDIDFATQNVGFFLVPFAALFVLLAEVEWSARLLRLAGVVIIAEAALFAVLGISQYLAAEIFWNPALIASNDVHFYFRVNSLFWDPNIYGRYLALVSMFVLAAIVFRRADEPRMVCLLAILWLGLLFAFSQSSFAALLIGVAVLTALRWGWPRTLAGFAAVGVGVVIAVLAFAAPHESSRKSPPDVPGNRGTVDKLSEGRGTLFSGGLRLARDRPALGHGSASFSEAFREAEQVSKGKNTLSHNEPITVVAEQGAVGLIAYFALLAAGLWTVLSGVPALAGRLHDGGSRGPPPEPVTAIATLGIAAAFCALLLHTIGYAGFLTDPLTWALLAVGGILATRRGELNQERRRPPPV